MLFIKNSIIMVLCGLISSQVFANDKSDIIGSTFHHQEYDLSHWKEGLIASFSGHCSLIKNNEHMRVICQSINGDDSVSYTLVNGNTDNYFFKKNNKKYKVTAENFKSSLSAGVNFYKPVTLSASGVNHQVIFFHL
jgi:hypothetical protein